MRSGDATRRTYFSDQLTRFNFIAELHIDAAQVAVHRDEPETVIDVERVAVEEELAGFDDFAGGGGANRSARGRRDVHAGMWIAGLTVEDAP